MTVVRKKDQQGSSYDFTVRRKKVLDALLYRIQNDTYYKGLEIDMHALDELLEKNKKCVKHD